MYAQYRMRMFFILIKKIKTSSDSFFFFLKSISSTELILFTSEGLQAAAVHVEPSNPPHMVQANSEHTAA